MATRELINLGIAPDSGTGDSARNGGQKINNIFADIYTQFGDNPIGQDPNQPFYGYRRQFNEFEYMVGELHPAGAFPVVYFKTPVNNDSDRIFTDGWGFGVDNTGAWIDTNGNGIPDIYEDSEWYFLSRGEQITADLSEVDDYNSVNFVLPLAKAGDVVRIKDTKGTWYDRTINVWTTPYEFISDAQVAEWGLYTPDSTKGYPDSDAWSIQSKYGERKDSAYKKVVNNTSNPEVASEFRWADGTNRFAPIYFQNLAEAEITFLYRGPDLGWVYGVKYNRSNQTIIEVLQDFFEVNEWIEWTDPDVVQDAQTIITQGQYILPISPTIDLQEIYRAGSTPNFKVYKRVSDDLLDPTGLTSIQNFLQSVVVTNRGNYNTNQLTRAEFAWGRDQTGVNSADPPWTGFQDVQLADLYQEITVTNIVDLSGNILLITDEPFVGYANVFIPEEKSDV